MVFGPVPEVVVVTVPEPVPELLPESGAAEELEDEPDEFPLTLDELEELPLTLDEPEELPLTLDEPDEPDEPDAPPPAADELDEPEGSPPAVDELDEPEELPLTAVELEVLDEPATDPEAVPELPEFPPDVFPAGSEADELPEDVVTGVVLMESTSPKLFPGCVFEVICEFLATCLPRSISDAPPSAEFPLALPWVFTEVLLPS